MAGPPCIHELAGMSLSMGLSCHEHGAEAAREIGADYYLDLSAQDQANVKLAIDELLRKVLANRRTSI